MSFLLIRMYLDRLIEYRTAEYNAAHPEEAAQNALSAEEESANAAAFLGSVNKRMQNPGAAKAEAERTAAGHLMSFMVPPD